MINNVVNKRKSNKIVNEEGYNVYKMRDDQALFLEGASFLIKNGFYQSEEERLKSFESLIERNAFLDTNYVLACLYFLINTLGIRLAPTLMLMKLLLMNRSSDYKYKLNPNEFMKIRKIILETFTRPDFIANAFSYWKYRKGNIKRIPGFMWFKERFENYSETTLKNRKMINREFSLADLIKILKPQPNNNYMSMLYRSIIEKSKLSKLKVEILDDKIKADHITAAISSDKISYSQKQQFVSENISAEIPINALIKNLSFLKGIDAPILKKRLHSAFKSNGMRIINPFDLILLQNNLFGKYSVDGNEVRIDKKIIEVLDEILNTYVKFDVDCDNPIILYDRSGSMNVINHRNGSKFVGLMKTIFEKDFKFYTFAGNYQEFGCRNQPLFGSLIPEAAASIIDMTAFFKEIGTNCNPNNLATLCYQGISPNGDTALLDAMDWTIKNNPNCDLLIIITDEVSWSDTKKIDGYRRIVPDRLNNKVIMVNVDPNQKSVLKPSSKVTRLSGLDGKILTFVKSILNFDKFKEDIIHQFELTMKK